MSSSSDLKVGSNLPLEFITLEPVFDSGAKSHGKSESPNALSPGSFTAVYQWRGNGNVALSLLHGSILASSRVFASISEYATAWNVDRFFGKATIQVLNVSPYNGGVWVVLAINWSSPLNTCISLFVDP